MSNDLNGSIPPELSLLSSLQVFVAQENKLRGHLDSAFCGLINLGTVVLEDNRISGTLPPCIFERNPNISELSTASDGRRMNTSSNFAYSLCALACHATAVFNVAKNNINGTIPNAALAAPKLSHLQLFQNYLTGTIPEAMEGDSRYRKLTS